MDVKMLKSTPLIYIMFSIVFLSIAILSISSYYGSDWNWIGEQVAGFVLLFMVMSIGLFTLMGWIRGR